MWKHLEDKLDDLGFRLHTVPVTCSYLSVLHLLLSFLSFYQSLSLIKRLWCLWLLGEVSVTALDIMNLKTYEPPWCYVVYCIVLVCDCFFRMCNKGLVWKRDRKTDLQTEGHCMPQAECKHFSWRNCIVISMNAWYCRGNVDCEEGRYFHECTLGGCWC